MSKAIGRAIIFCAGAAATAVALIGCREKPVTATANDLPVVTVRAQPARLQKRLATEDAAGTVRAKLHAKIEAKVSGRIEKMLVVQGQPVKAGDLLAQLDVREIQARLDQTLAARDQADRDLKRISELFQQRIANQSELDAALARSRIAQGAATEAETMLGYSKITAPFAGVVTRKLADVGDLAVPGKLLLELEDPTEQRLEADVPEALIDRVRLGDKLPVRVPALTRELEGTISEIAPAADPASRTFLVKLDLPPTTGLRSGLFGRVAVPVNERSVLCVPASALVLRGQMEMVFIAANRRAQLRLVRTGGRFGDVIELLSGVSAGEQIVTEGAVNLIDGQPIAIE